MEQKIKYICLLRFMNRLLKMERVTHEEAMMISDYEQRSKMKEEIEQEIKEGVKEGMEEYQNGLIQLINLEEGYGVMLRSEQEKRVYQQILQVIDQIKRETKLQFTDGRQKRRYDMLVQRIQVIDRKYRITYTRIEKIIEDQIVIVESDGSDDDDGSDSDGNGSGSDSGGQKPTDDGQDDKQVDVYIWDEKQKTIYDKNIKIIEQIVNQF